MPDRAPGREIRAVELKGSRTEKNLMSAFAGESQARNRYTYFASQAKRDGFEHIAFVFQETADQEKEHAKRFFSFLQGGECQAAGMFPAGVTGTTAENLAAAAAGELMEWGALYPDFAQVARDEGFRAIAVVFEKIAVAEQQHERRYSGLLASVEAGTVFKKDKPVKWRCRNCGYVHESAEAPAACPACAHPQAHYELLAENW
jgi:rubrerythrin